MGYLGLVFGPFTLGYILGVWTVFPGLRKPPRAYEDAVIVLRDARDPGAWRP